MSWSASSNNINLCSASSSLLWTHPEMCILPWKKYGKMVHSSNSCRRHLLHHRSGVFLTEGFCLVQPCQVNTLDRVIALQETVPYDNWSKLGLCSHLWRGIGWRTVLVTQSCPTLCDPIDWGPPLSSVHEILQSRILEWVAIPFSRGFPDSGIKPGSLALQTDSFPSEPPGKPKNPTWVRVKVADQAKIKGVHYKRVE